MEGGLDVSVTFASFHAISNPSRDFQLPKVSQSTNKIPEYLTINSKKSVPDTNLMSYLFFPLRKHFVPTEGMVEGKSRTQNS